MVTVVVPSGSPWLKAGELPPGLTVNGPFGGTEAGNLDVSESHARGSLDRDKNAGKVRPFGL